MAYEGLSGKWIMHTDEHGDLYRVQITVNASSDIDLSNKTKVFGYSDNKEIIAAAQAKGWIYFLTYMTPQIRLEKIRPDGTEHEVLDYNLYEIGEAIDNVFPDPQNFLRVTSDGKWLVYRTLDGDMFKVKTSGKDKQLLFGSSTGIYRIIEAICVGEWVYYIRDDVTNERTTYSEIRKVKLDGTSDELIKQIDEYKDGKQRQTLAITEDGNWMIYTVGWSAHVFNLNNPYEEYKLGGYQTGSIPITHSFVLDNKIHFSHEEWSGTNFDYDKYDIIANAQGFEWKNWQDVDDTLVNLTARTSYSPIFFGYMPDLAVAEDPWKNDAPGEGSVQSVLPEDEKLEQELIDGAGAYIKLKLTLQKPELCSEITLKPFTKYPLEIVSLKYEEDTDTHYQPVELIQHIENKESTGTLSLAFPAVLAKRFTIVICQKNYEKNTYLIREDSLQEKDLWAKISTREAEVTLDLGDGIEQVEQGKVDGWTGWDIYLSKLEEYKKELKAWQAEVDEYNKQYEEYEEDLSAYYDTWTDFQQTLRRYGYRYNNVDDIIRIWGR